MEHRAPGREGGPPPEHCPRRAVLGLRRARDFDLLVFASSTIALRDDAHHSPVPGRVVPVPGRSGGLGACRCSMRILKYRASRKVWHRSQPVVPQTRVRSAGGQQRLRPRSLSAMGGGPAEGLGVTAPAVQHLDASYFDTPDLSLAAAGITLRRRTGGEDAGWHLKLPVSPGTRRELRAPLGPAPAPVPDDLTARVTDWTLGQPLQLVATLETTRTVRRITGPAGEDLAEVADDLVVGRRPGPDGGAGTSLSWREIEVELISGTSAILAAASARLRAAGAWPSASASKLSRVLGAGDAPPPAHK